MQSEGGQSGHDLLSAQEEKILRTIDQRAPEMIARVKAWSAINSGSHHRAGLAAQRAVLMEAFAALDGEMREVPLPSAHEVDAAGQTQVREFEPALRIIKRPEAPVQIILTGHYDTVFAKDSPFQEWQMRGADVINGPGVADMKGGLIVMREALLALEKSPDRAALGYCVLISPDEEIGSLGSAALLAKHGAQADLGMTYEPALADGSLSGARKGSGNFSLVVRGRSAHAGRAHHEGRNAMVAAARAVQALANLSGARDGLTVNVARIDGGGANNIVPDLAIVRFNVRLAQPDDAAWAQQAFEKITADIDRDDGISASLQGGFTRPPKPMAPPNARLFDMTKKAGAALGLDINWRDTGGVCEGNNLWAVGCPNVDTLGVRGGDIHSPREFAILSSFPERARLSALMLLRFASGVFDAKSLKRGGTRA